MLRASAACVAHHSLISTPAVIEHSMPNATPQQVLYAEPLSESEKCEEVSGRGWPPPAATARQEVERSGQLGPRLPAGPSAYRMWPAGRSGASCSGASCSDASCSESGWSG